MGAAKANWGDLTVDELTQVAGQHDALLGLVQKKYGAAPATVEQPVNLERAVHHEDHEAHEERR